MDTSCRNILNVSPRLKVKPTSTVGQRVAPTEAFTSIRLQPGVSRASKLTPPRCAAVFFFVLCSHPLYWP